MDFLISPAWAQAAPSGGGGAQLLIMVAIFFLIMYFLLIRPQQKRAKEHRDLIASLNKGDEVMTSGGILGRVAEIDKSFILLEVQSGVNIRVQKQAVSSVMPKGTFKDA